MYNDVMQMMFHTNAHIASGIQAGQVVDFNTPFARKTVTRQERISVTEPLGIAPKEIFLHLLKVVGEEVQKDELLAEKKGMFGTKQLISEFAGTIKEINHEDGSVTLEMKTEINQDESSYFTGRIADIKDQTVTLDVNEYKSLELKESSGDFGGEMLRTAHDNLAALHADIVENKVIVIEEIKPAEVVRLDVLDENGLVTLKDIEPIHGTKWARVKNLPDWETIMQCGLRYCIIDSKNNTMYLYN